MFRQTTLLSHLPKKGKGFETAYVDTATAIQKENGLDDLKKVAKAAGVSNEDLETAIAQKGHLAVPVEVYAQSKASPELLESVSFSADTDSMARMKEHAKEIREAMTEAHEEAVKQQIDIMEAILGEWFPVAENAGEDMKRRMEREKDMAGAAILTRMDNPMQGWHELYKKAKQSRQAMLQPALDALARGMKQGVDIIQNEDGSGVRVSNNEQWYRDFYKEHGRAPTQTELLDMARAMVAGEATAPKVEGWWLTNLSESEAKGMEQQKAELGQLDENMETLESIKERMKELDGVELKLTAGLTAEGYSVYRRVMADLKSIGGRASKAARMNAVLLARHADLYAKVVAEKTGKKFTALDYYHTFMVQAGREGDAVGGLNQKEAEKEKEAVRKQYAGTAQWMKAPNGKATNLTEDQWLTVRTPAFKAWFGDWEKRAVAEELQGLSPLNVLPTGKKLGKKEAEQIFSEFGDIWNKRYGTYALFPKSTVGKILRHKGFDISQILEVIPHLFETSVLAFTEPEYIKRGHKAHPNILAYHHYVNKFMADGKVYYIRFSLMEEKTRRTRSEKRILHSTAISDVRVYEENQKDASFQRIRVIDPGEGSETPFLDYKLSDFLSSVKDCSKVVDENGEPLVVYHATLSDFTKFRPSESGLYGKGIYLTADKEDTSYTLKDKDWRVMELFANIQNPRDPEAMATQADIDAAKKEALDFFEKHPFDKDGTPASFVVNNLLFWGMQPGKVKKSKLTQILKDAFARKGVAYQENDKHDGAIIQRDGATWYTADQPNQVKSATGNTGAFSAMDENIYNQRAWVGSAADFDKFDLGYVGTGEGAQVHGYGLYSAQGRDVAEGYKERLSALLNEAEEAAPEYDYVEVIQFNGFRYEKPEGYDLWAFEPGTADEVYVDDPAESAVLEKLNEVQDISKARTFFEEELEAKRKGEWGETEYSEDTLEKAVAMLSPENIQDENLEVSTEEPPEPEAFGGTLFEVEIPDDDVLLDEQKPLAEQPKKVLQGLRKALKSLSADEMRRFFQKSAYGTEEYDKIQQEMQSLSTLVFAPISVGRGGRFGKQALLRHGYSDEDIADFQANPERGKQEAARLREEYAPRIKELQKKIRAFTTRYLRDEYVMQNRTGRNFYQALAAAYESDKEASQALNKYGIEGITYVGGRDGRCFVVFDDEAIDIIEKFNQRVRNANQGRIVKNSAGRRVIELFEGADASTFLHEMGHMFLMDLEDLARLEDAASKKDLATVDEWASWHEGAAKDYEGSPWEEEFKAREQAILDAHAAGDVLTERRLKEEWRHERFARGFELYLREGKAPSSVLRSVFRKFKEFLRRIYKTAISLGARPSAKVEAVMARMVATEEEIRAASLDERYRSVEEAGGEKLFTESERETYERWRREAEEDAEEALRVLVMRDLEERGRKEIAESVQEEERRAREALEKEPVYMAEAAMEASGDADVVLHWFASREDFLKERAKRKPLEEELKAHVQGYAAKKEQEMIASHFTEEKIAEAMESPEGYKKRLSLEAAAYRRKERLLSRVSKKADAAMEELEAALKAAPEHLDFTAEKDTEEAQKVQKAAARLRYGAKWDAKESQEIDDLRRAGTREEMAEKLGAFREKVQERRQKERGGKQRVQGEEEASNWRAFEEELLQRERVFRETAEGILRQRPLAESCNPNFYRQRERRHARTAAKMVKAGRWDMARLAKENQAMSAACAFAAERNKEKLEKLLAGVKKKLGAKTVRLAAQERYWLHHLAYFLRLKDRDAQVPAEGAKDLTTMFHGYEESLDVSAGDAPATLLNVLLSGEFSGYSSLTLDEFAGAVNVMNILYTVGRDMFKMKSIKGKDVQDIVAEIMASKSRLAPKPVEEHAVAPDAGGVGYNDVLARVPGLGEKMAQIGQQGSLNMMKPELMEKVLSRENLNRAFKRVKKNKGAAGVDGMTIEETQAHLKKGNHAKELVERIRRGKYTPQPVRSVGIPKPDGGERKLGIPTVIDRTIQQAITQQLVPIYEPLFAEGSYGYRPGRSAKDAIRKVKEYAERGYTYAVALDLSKYFDTLNHEILLQLLRKNVKDERVIQLIKRYLKSGIMEKGVVREREEGSPQGGNLSPLLANIYLNEFDQEYAKRGVPCIRYADDIVLLAKSKRAAQRIMVKSTAYLEGKLKLKVNQEKSRTVSVFATKHFTRRWCRQRLHKFS